MFKTLAILCTAPLAHAQLAIDWYSIDGGGGNGSGGGFSLAATIGQADAGRITGGTFTLDGGFWAAALGATCYPNCDNSTIQPILNVGDFSCFLANFAAGNQYANCDASVAAPVLNVNDFTCFLAKYAAGCT